MPVLSWWARGSEQPRTLPEGIDSLKGRNLAVLGTPHMSEFSFMSYKSKELRELHPEGQK